MRFSQKLNKITEKNNSLLCIGLDPELEKLPKHLLKSKDPIFEFNKSIIDSTYDLVCAYKPNIAFYEACGIPGLTSLKKTIEYLHDQYSTIPIVLDAKRADIGNTARMYAKSAFEYWQADAVTVYPHLGLDSVLPFFEYKDKLTILLIKTSNPDSKMFQDLPVYSSSDPEPAEGEPRRNSSRQARTTPYYLKMAKIIKNWTYPNMGIFVGATYPEQMKKIRTLFPDKVFLSAGIGAQAAETEKIVKAGINSQKRGIMFNASRSIIYAFNKKDFAQKSCEEAEKLRSLINQYRK